MIPTALRFETTPVSHGCSSTSSSRFLFPSEAPTALQGASSSAVPCNMLNEKYLNVLCPGCPHRQQSSRFRKYTSCSFCGTPFRASSFETQWFFPPHHSWVFLGHCSSSFLLGSPFFPLSFRFSSFFSSSFAMETPFDASLATLSAFHFSTWIPAR